MSCDLDLISIPGTEPARDRAYPPRLWCGEQFASDLHKAFPRLKIVTLSANKLLGQLGQGFATPQTGFSFHEQSHHFEDSCVLLISHSGGTFGTLNVSNLLKGFTRHLFVVTSEWDTQVARAVRAGKPGRVQDYSDFEFASYVFTTFCGCRTAEPCSLTVAATHHLLSQILLHLMYGMRVYEPSRPHLGGATFRTEEVRELGTLLTKMLDSLDALSQPDSATRKELLAQGELWAKHVLEGPIAWLMGAVYILVTVTVGYTPLSAAVLAISYGATGKWGFGEALDVAPSQDPVKYLVGLCDAVIYLFIPWWMTVLLRLLQGRTWHHRVAGRSLLIGDVPWVAQCLEAFVSKLFALSYSIASLSVASGNPCDHLVHRYTHRVVRGGLLAVGRPDGRLNALASAENTVCLSVCQASSIQNMGVTCESFTLGHNPYKLGLSKSAVFLPTARPKFLSEWLLNKMGSKTMSSAAIMGVLSDAAKDEAGAGAGPAAKQDKDLTLKPLAGKYVGEWMSKDPELAGKSTTEQMEKQALLQSLFEGRCASLERFVGFLILFHCMGKRVQDFWRSTSGGLLGYDMSRSHSIMRIATTASPVSGSEVRIKMIELQERTMTSSAAKLVQKRWRARLKAKERLMDQSRAARKLMHQISSSRQEMNEATKMAQSPEFE